jgi:hypothetical protein
VAQRNELENTRCLAVAHAVNEHGEDWEIRWFHVSNVTPVTIADIAEGRLPSSLAPGDETVLSSIAPVWMNEAFNTMAEYGFLPVRRGLMDAVLMLDTRGLLSMTDRMGRLNRVVSSQGIIPVVLDGGEAAQTKNATPSCPAATPGSHAIGLLSMADRMGGLNRVASSWGSTVSGEKTVAGSSEPQKKPSGLLATPGSHAMAFNHPQLGLR